jgi:hypothetical protein
MSLRLGALHDALLHPGDADMARKAAEEVAGYENRLAAIDTKLAVVQALLGIIVLLLGGVLWQGFTIMGRLPR